MKEVQIIDAPIQPNYQVFSGNGKTTIKSLKAGEIIEAGEISKQVRYQSKRMIEIRKKLQTI